MKTKLLSIIAVGTISWCLNSSDGLAQNLNSLPSHLNGFWEIPVGSRSIPQASLVDSISQEKLDEIAFHDARAIRWCNMLGVPHIMTQQSRPLEIWAGPNHVAMLVLTKQASPRYAYLDMEQHVDPLIFDPSTNGQSIAHWEGDTLVVDTIGFSGDKGGLAIPGGGFRTEQSRLLERFTLIDDETLSIVSTWTDPGVFAEPHTYEIRYKRLPDSYQPPPFIDCNSDDEVRARFLEEVWGGPGSLD